MYIIYIICNTCEVRCVLDSQHATQRPVIAWAERRSLSPGGQATSVVLSSGSKYLSMAVNLWLIHG